MDLQTASLILAAVNTLLLPAVWKLAGFAWTVEKRLMALEMQAGIIGKGRA